MGDLKISLLPSATLPLATADIKVIVQGGVTNQISVGEDKLNRSITASVTTTYQIDWNAAESWDLTMTGNTIFTQTNIPPANTEKTIVINLIGVFSPTDIVAWGIIGAAYDGTNGSQIVVSSWNNGQYHAVRNDKV